MRRCADLRAMLRDELGLSPRRRPRTWRRGSSPMIHPCATESTAGAGRDRTVARREPRSSSAARRHRGPPRGARTAPHRHHLRTGRRRQDPAGDDGCRRLCRQVHPGRRRRAGRLARSGRHRPTHRRRARCRATPAPHAGAHDRGVHPRPAGAARARQLRARPGCGRSSRPATEPSLPAADRAGDRSCAVGAAGGARPRARAARRPGGRRGR